MAVKNKKSILVLLDNHFTHDSRVLKESVSLVNAGYDVTVKCYFDEGLLKEEVINGVKVGRILFTSRQYQKNIIHKIYLLFSYLFKILRSKKAYDAIHCNDLVMLFVGVVVKWFSKEDVKVVYDSHEYQIERNGQAKWKKPLLKNLESFLMKHTEVMIVVSDSIAMEYARIYNIEKPYVILNTPPYVEASNNNIFREKFDISEDKIIYLYQGGFNYGRNIENILEMFKSMDDPKRVIVFMGYGSLNETIKEYAASNDNIFYHEAVSPSELPSYTSSADIGLCLIENTCLSYYYCLPNKFFEYMMADIPAIVSDLYELNKISEEYETCWVLPEGDMTKLEDIIQSITLQDIETKKRNLNNMKRIFCWEEQEKELIRIYDNILKDEVA